MDTALHQKFPFILDRNLTKANCTENRVCTSCDTVVLAHSSYHDFLAKFSQHCCPHLPSALFSFKCGKGRRKFSIFFNFNFLNFNFLNFNFLNFNFLNFNFLNFNFLNFNFPLALFSFKCGKEARKRVCVWGLRVRSPPPVPSFHLPSSGSVTEQVVMRHCTTNEQRNAATRCVLMVSLLMISVLPNG